MSMSAPFGRLQALILVLVMNILVVASSVAAPFQGKQTIFLVEQDGTKHNIGSVQFQSDSDKITYRIEWRADRFTDHFLSMRPFKCIEGPKKHWCQVPYPYEIRRTVSANDLTDLEYDTLFIWKGSTEYGINMWNGVYYKLRVDGDKLVGELHDIDMDTLSAPPGAGILRPVREADLEPGEFESHWLPTLVIE